MIAQSLAADHDLDLANNYANDDGRLFGHRGLTAGPHVARTRFGGVESVHDVGLALLLLPPYAAARAVASRTPERWLARFRMDRGLFAYSIVSLTLIALTSIAVGFLASALEWFTGLPGVGYLSLALAVSPPIVGHSFLVFPECIAFAATCLVIWFSVKPPASRDARVLIVICLMLGALPSVHRKYTAYVFGLLFLIVWYRAPAIRQHVTRRASAWASAAFLVPIAAFHAWSWHRWGTIGGPQMLQTVPFSARAMSTGLAGLWLDRQSGVLSYAPIYWIFPFALGCTFKRTWAVLVPIALLYIPMAAFVEWWGGFAPAGRYLVPCMPLCAVAMADGMRVRWLKVAALVLMVPQAMIDAALWQHPRALWPAGRVNPMLELFGRIGAAYERLLPFRRGVS